jgi:hypothetical protein
MTVLVPHAVIKHDGEFIALQNDLRSIFHRFYKKTLQRSVIDQILAGIRHIASFAIMSRTVLDELIEGVRNFFRTWQEVTLVRRSAPE